MLVPRARELLVIEPPARPGESADFTHFDIPAADAAPRPDDLRVVYFLVAGLGDPYAGGEYVFQLIVPDDFPEKYDPDRLPLPANFLPQHPFNNGEMTIRDEALLPWPRTEAAVRKELHEYYATITAMDFHMGRIIAALILGGYVLKGPA